MVKERIKMKKIDNASARKVTFSKRRRGLFKKAEELGILCDAKVAVAIFSTSGKLFEYSSSSGVTNAILRYNLHSNNTAARVIDQLPPLHRQLGNGGDQDCILKATEDSKTKQTRKMKEEDILGLDLEELHRLEKILEAGLQRVLEAKEERFMGELAALKNKIVKLNEANMNLKKKMAVVSQNKHARVLIQSMDSVVEEGSMDIVSDDDHRIKAKSSDTSLKLGLPFSN